MHPLRALRIPSPTRSEDMQVRIVVAIAPMRSIHVRRDSRSSIAYSEELISATMSATLQSTDRHDGIVGQECCHFQRDL